MNKPPNWILSYREMPNENTMPDGFQMEEIPQGKAYMVREGMLPGLFGFPDLHITHLYTEWQTQTVLIIAYTERQLLYTEREEISLKAVDFLEQLEEGKNNE